LRLTPRSLSAPIAALLLVGGLTACGGSGDAKKIVSETFSGHKKVDSANLALALDVTPQGGSSGPVSIKLSGPFQNQGANQVPRFDFNLGITVKGQSLSAGLVSTGTALYPKFQGQAYNVPDQVFTAFGQSVQKAQAQRNQSSDQGTLGQFGVNPQGWLKSPTKQGSADVGATSTDHVSADVDVPRLLADISTILSKAGSLGLNTTGRLPTGLTPQQIQSAQRSIKRAHLDLYSAKSDHSLRRLTLDVSYAPPAGTAGDLHLDLQLTGLNAPQAIAAPANPQPFSNLTSVIRTLTGGAGLGGVLGGGAGPSSGSGSGPTGSGGTPGSATPSPTSANAQTYLKCVQAAGADTGKASQCLSLLSK